MNHIIIIYLTILGLFGLVYGALQFCLEEAKGLGALAVLGGYLLVYNLAPYWEAYFS